MITTALPIRVGIMYPSDPLGNVPSGIDSFIKGILKFRPTDICYTLVGASSCVASRPLLQQVDLPGLGGSSSFVPLVAVDSAGKRSRWPLTLRYLWALRSFMRDGGLKSFEILDFHRIEPVLLFHGDSRPKNLVLHQDMAVLRDPQADIGWRHLPMVYEFLERRVLGKASRVFCVRQSAVDRYSRALPELAPRVEFIPTWVDTDTYRFEADGEARAQLKVAGRSRLGLDAGHRVAVFVGRLDRQKDPLLLLESFSRARQMLGQLHLVVIGDGVLRAQFERHVQASGLQGNVTLLGALPSEEVAAWLRVADLFVLSSAYEGMPIAVLEALAVGVPVVTTAVGEVARVVVNGSTGRVVPSRDPADIAGAICRTLKDAEDAEMSRRCVNAVGNYTPERVLSRIYDNHRAQARR